MPNIACLNGKFMPLSRARVPVEDRGYQFGDGIYEVIRVAGGYPLFLDEHLGRMRGNARALGLPFFYTFPVWRRMIAEACRKSRFREARIYIQLTRGVAPRDHAGPRRLRPTVLVTVRRHVPVKGSVREKGVPVISIPDIRWGRCDIKTINLLPNVLAKQEARDRKVFEALFVRDGCVLEGATSNLFAVLGGSLVTPPKGPRLLPGITRDVVISLAKAAGLRIKERSLALRELYRAQEVFLSGTTIDVLSVVKADGRRIGSGRPGPCARLLYGAFQRLISR